MMIEVCARSTINWVSDSVLFVMLCMTSCYEEHITPWRAQLEIYSMLFV
jgi:hypothetical protein